MSKDIDGDWLVLMLVSMREVDTTYKEYCRECVLQIVGMESRLQGLGVRKAPTQTMLILDRLSPQCQYPHASAFIVNPKRIP